MRHQGPKVQGVGGWLCARGAVVGRGIRRSSLESGRVGGSREALVATQEASWGSTGMRLRLGGEGRVGVGGAALLEVRDRRHAAKDVLSGETRVGHREALKARRQLAGKKGSGGRGRVGM